MTLDQLYETALIEVSRWQREAMEKAMAAKQHVISETRNGTTYYVTEMRHQFTIHKVHAKKFTFEEATAYVDEYYTRPEERLGLIEEV